VPSATSASLASYASLTESWLKYIDRRAALTGKSAKNKSQKIVWRNSYAIAYNLKK